MFDQSKLPRAVHDLANLDTRCENADRLAAALGAAALIVLIKDREVGALLPAPGFSSTLPGGPSWEEFLKACAAPGAFSMEVAFPDTATLQPAHAYVAESGAVVVLIGGEPSVSAHELHDEFVVLIRLFETEQRSPPAEAAAAAGALADRRATALATVLDEARQRLAQQTRQLQEALAEADRLNEAQRHLNETLEERVATEIAERMKAEDTLRQAQKMEAVGQLTGGIAHDFNNLLTVILGSLEQMGRDFMRMPDDPSALRLRRLRDMAQQAGERAATLTSRLLAFARRQPLNPKPIDANRLLGSLSDLLARTLGEEIHLEVVTAPGLWACLADSNELESALVNLAVNARDAMGGGGYLTIETGNVMLDDDYVATVAEPVEPGQYVMLAVTDTGTGMDAATLERVFEPFFTTKEPGKGTGLGLSQVYGFIRQSGGHIRIYSELGHGTTVKLYLPRVQKAVGRDIWPTNRNATLDRGTETILVVEDHADLRSYTVSLLTELGYRVLEAANGHEALEILERGAEVDLLFTDVVLPDGLNGRATADEVMRRRPGVKVLFTTGYTRNAIVHDGRLDADVHFIAKPFTFETLAAKVRQVLDL